MQLRPFGLQWIQPPSRTEATARVFGANRMPIVATDYAPRFARPVGPTLNGLGDATGPGGLVWSNNDAFNDFISGADTTHGKYPRWPGYKYGGTFTAAWNLANGSNGAAVKRTFLANAQPIVDNISKNLQPFGLWQRSAAQDDAYYEAMDQLVGMIINTLPKLQAAASQDQAARQAAESAEVVAADKAAYAAEQASKSGLVSSSGPQKGVSAANALPKWVPYAAAGAAVLVVGYMVFKR